MVDCCPIVYSKLDQAEGCPFCTSSADSSPAKADADSQIEVILQDIKSALVTFEDHPNSALPFISRLFTKLSDLIDSNASSSDARFDLDIASCCRTISSSLEAIDSIDSCGVQIGLAGLTMANAILTNKKALNPPCICQTNDGKYQVIWKAQGRTLHIITSSDGPQYIAFQPNDDNDIEAIEGNYSFDLGDVDLTFQWLTK